jgi:hypothetical protein
MTKQPDSNEKLNHSFKQIFDRLLDEQMVAEKESSRIPKTFDRKKSINIQDQIANEKAALDNVEKAQDIRLKKNTLIALFIFLAFETGIVFALAFLQGFKGSPTHPFELEEWSFRIVIGATISQITIMLLIAVRHLFPTK